MEKRGKDELDLDVENGHKLMMVACLVSISLLFAELINFYQFGICLASVLFGWIKVVNNQSKTPAIASLIFVFLFAIFSMVLNVYLPLKG